MSSRAARAVSRPLPTETHHDLEEAIFSDGISTRDESTETSGRGVGLSAVRAVVSEMGGSIQIQTAQGRGTEFTFLFPILKLRPSYVPAGELHGAGAI